MWPALGGRESGLTKPAHGRRPARPGAAGRRPAPPRRPGRRITVPVSPGALGLPSRALRRAANGSRGGRSLPVRVPRTERSFQTTNTARTAKMTVVMSNGSCMAQGLENVRWRASCEGAQAPISVIMWMHLAKYLLARRGTREFPKSARGAKRPGPSWRKLFGATDMFRRGNIGSILMASFWPRWSFSWSWRRGSGSATSAPDPGVERARSRDAAALGPSALATCASLSGADLPGGGSRRRRAGMLGALFLILPGFITDLIGLALIPPLGRQWIMRRFGCRSCPRAGRAWSADHRSRRRRLDPDRQHALALREPAGRLHWLSAVAGASSRTCVVSPPRKSGCLAVVSKYDVVLNSSYLPSAAACRSCRAAPPSGPASAA